MYCVDGMRKSGDPNTSCGNTLINGLVHLYCFHQYYSMINKLDMLDPANKPSNTGVKLLLLGDDNLGWLPEMFGEYINSGEFTKDARKLGLIAKAKISKDIYDAEYCSSRLWCLHDDIWVSGPKLGRMWTRFGVTNT